MGNGVNTRTIERDDRLAALARIELAHDFELADPVGVGRGTAVFAARERHSGREVMLKVIARPEGRADADALFRAALTAHASFDHPHLVPVLRHGATDSLFWFTRANIRATPLADVLAQGTRLDERRVRHLATQAASALEYLHRRGLAHGALTTRNILLDPAGWVHLCDPAVDLTRRPSGRTPTPTFADSGSPATDQHALAAVLYECIAGTPPDAELTAIHGDPAFPAKLGRAIARALHPDARERFPRLGDFIWALEDDAPRPVAPKPRGRTSDGILFVRDWQPPAQRDTARILRIAGITLAVLVVAWFLLPRLVAFVQPRPPARVVTVPTSTDAPAATTPPPAPATSAPARPASRPPATTRATTPAAAPATPAVLYINSTPWGRVSIDGNEIGNTPRANIAVAPGNHTVRIVRDGYLPFERRLRLAPGDTMRLTDIVLVERPQ